MFRAAMGDPYEEFWEAEGQPRLHQRLLWEYLAGLGPAEKDALGRAVLRRVHEQDVTFNIFGVPDGKGQQWGLDWLPAVLDSERFGALASSLRQRARVLSLALDDLYGPRRLLEQRVLPPSLVLGNPRYLRPAHGWRPVGDSRLQLYAADVGRNPDGEFVVFSDRTSAPTGSGYALQNRMVIGRALPEPFRRYPVAKIDGYFSAVSRMLHSLAPRGQQTPRIVLLTPGRTDESAFEHAYLARYLGFDLVEGGDLIARDGRVYLKSLAGLLQVDVILRRIADPLCDPLQLRGDSLLGVPGLLEAARRGAVGIANPIGSTLVEAPAFKAYLPAISRALLGEDLALPSVATRWCGDPMMLEEVMDSADAWCIKPAFDDRRQPPLRLATLVGDEREAALARLRRESHRWVAESWPEPSRVPIGAEPGSQASLTLRAFLCKRPGSNDFFVMPGALGRLDASPDALFIERGGDRLSKDVWVPDIDSERASLLPRMPEPQLRLLRGGVDFPSRLLDDIYWLGRYIERCEITARLLRLGIERQVVAGKEVSELLQGALQGALQGMDIVAPGEGLHPHDELNRLALAATASPNNLWASLERVHLLSEDVRGRLSREAWEALQQFRDVLDDLQGATALEISERAPERLQTILLLTAAIRGAVTDGMVHTHAWSFLELGRRLERASTTLVLMQAFLPVGATRQHLEMLLEASDSLLTYRARYLTSLRVLPVVDLLLIDETNPRSVLFQIERLLQHASSLPRQSVGRLEATESRLIRLRACLATTDIVHICAGDGEGLRSLFGDSLAELRNVSDDLARQYFSHTALLATESFPEWADTEEP